MSAGSDLDVVEWFRYSFVAADALVKAWLTTEIMLAMTVISVRVFATRLIKALLRKFH